MGLDEHSGATKPLLRLATVAITIGLVAGCGNDESAEVPQDVPVDEPISDGGSS